LNLARPILDALGAKPERRLLSLTDARGHLASEYTRTQLLARSAAWQERFTAAGLAAGDPVALSPSRTLDLPAMHLAALASGLAVVPLNPALSAPERRRLLESSGVRVAASSPALAQESGAMADELGLQWISEDELSGDTQAGVHVVDVESSGPALVLYTSGTTGRPKSVALSHGNLLANLRALETLWARGPGDHLVHVLPAHHFHGLVLGIYGSLLAACSLVLMPGFEARATLDAIAGLRANLIMAVPTIYARMLEAAGEGDELSGLRLAISGSAPLPEELALRFRQRFGLSLINRYGLTECGILTSNPPTSPRRGSVGLPLAGNDVRISEPNADGVGEIVARGASVMASYAEAMRDGYFHTGDLGRFDADGYLYVVGRKKELIIVGGSNVVPGEIEAVLAPVDGVSEVVVAGLPDDDLGEIVAAFVVPQLGVGADLEARLRAAADEGLAKYKRPRVYRFLREIPRNAMGKVDRARLIRR